MASDRTSGQRERTGDRGCGSVEDKGAGLPHGTGIGFGFRLQRCESDEAVVPAAVTCLDRRDVHDPQIIAPRDLLEEGAVDIDGTDPPTATRQAA